jgi:hypothetical protein
MSLELEDRKEIIDIAILAIFLMKADYKKNHHGDIN